MKNHVKTQKNDANSHNQSILTQNYFQ